MIYVINKPAKAGFFMKDDNQNNSNFSKIIAGLILYSFLLIALFVANFSVVDISDDVGQWGSVGDYFGGLLNPILAFLSFIGVLWTLKMSREELFETRKVMNEQLKTQTLQQFENNFYQLFSQLNVLQDDLLTKWQSNIEGIIDPKQNCVYRARDTLRKKLRLSRYFILLYQIMKLINIEVPKFPSTYLINSDAWSSEKRGLKKFYTNLIRSQQDNLTLQMLFINCFDQRFPEFRGYLEEASFFKHMRVMDIDGSGYNYLVLSALPSYVLNIEDLKKSEGIPFFDKGVGLLGLIQPQISYLLINIYKFNTKKSTDFNFAKYIFEEFLIDRSGKLFSDKQTLDKIYFPTENFVEFNFNSFAQVKRWSHLFEQLKAYL